ncbi:hypothetical protein [Cetobacterium sp.]|uniref:hypothetical protein n=1 Tax=Cetobacterium sp. TaxID=2071632 RepID=UPI003F355F95
MGCGCKKPPLQPAVVFSSYVDRLLYNLKSDLILCPHCFSGLNFQNFKDIDYDKCESQSSQNKENRLKALSK